MYWNYHTHGRIVVHDEGMEAAMTMRPILTTEAGAPVVGNQDVVTARPPRPDATTNELRRRTHVG